MGSAGIRNIAVFGLAFGLCLDFSGSPGTAAEYEQAPEQVALTAPPLVQDAPAGNAVPPARTGDPAAGHGLNEFMSGLLDAIRENDSEAVSARIDTDGMFAEIQRQQIASVPTSGEKTGDRPKVQSPSLTLVRSSRLVPGFRLRMGLGLVDRRCDEALRLDPKLALAYLNRGNAYYNKGNLDIAIADYDEALRLNPKLALAYDNRGNAYGKEGDPDRAIADYDAAIRLDPKLANTLAPKLANAYCSRGLAYSKKGDRDRAIADYDAAIRLAPNNAVYHRNRGDSYRLKGEYDKARADYDETLALLPLALKDKTSPNYEILDYCVNLIEGYKALDNDRKPGFVKVHTALEKELPDRRSRQRSRAYSSPNTPGMPAPVDGRKMSLKAQWELFRERLARAEVALERAWRLDPNNARAATQMLIVELGQGKGRTHMEEWFRRAMKADPGNYSACSRKLYYLEPKWYGSEEEMLAFGASAWRRRTGMHDCRSS